LIGIFEMTRHQGAIRETSNYFFSMEIPLLPILMPRLAQRKFLVGQFAQKKPGEMCRAAKVIL